MLPPKWRTPLRHENADGRGEPPRAIGFDAEYIRAAYLP
jgi:hypothetical protein